jgi:hypothetical protein
MTINYRELVPCFMISFGVVLGCKCLWHALMNNDDSSPIWAVAFLICAGMAFLGIGILY